MNESDNQRYVRVVMRGQLHCCSNLHIGTGKQVEQQGYEQLLSEFCTDIKGWAIIPGSSLRGFLSHQLRNCDAHQTLFGCARKADNDEPSGDIQVDNDEDSGRAGALRVYDAWQSTEDAKTTARSRIAMNPVTGTTEENMLATQSLVLKGSVFNCRLELDDVSEAEIALILGALASLDAQVDAQLGQGKSHGQGLLQWSLAELTGMDESAFVDWLSNDLVLDAAFRKLSHIQPVVPAKANWQTVMLRLIPVTPILIIGNPVELPQQASDANQPDGADHVFMQENNQAVIPGSTLKGLLRAHCRRILLTLLPDSEDDSWVDDWLAPWFGDKQQGLGRLRWVDALADFDCKESKQNKHIHKQIFNAVDRFSGGVKHSALYQATAVKPEFFETHISLRSAEDSDSAWFYGLLLLVLRDAMEADLAVGWGKTKGLGSFRLAVQLEDQSWLSDWQAFSRLYQHDAQLQTGLAAFYQRIEQHQPAFTESAA